MSEGNTKTSYKWEDGEIIIGRHHDVTPILDSNKFLRSEQSLHHKSEVLNHVAHIDTIAIENWCKYKRGIKSRRKEDGTVEGWYEQFFADPQLLTDFLNDPDNALWRTRLGKI